MWKAKIYVTLKEGVLDPQGKAVQGALAAMGYAAVEAVRVGKYLEVTVNTPDRAAAQAQVDEMCHRLLSNPVIEEYTFDLVEVL